MAHATPGSASDNMEEVEQCGNKLAAHINSQFQLSSQGESLQQGTMQLFHSYISIISSSHLFTTHVKISAKALCN